MLKQGSDLILVLPRPLRLLGRKWWQWREMAGGGCVTYIELYELLNLLYNWEEESGVSP